LGARTYRPPRNDHVTEAGEMKENHPHEIAMTQLIPRIDEKNKRAVKTVQTSLYFFSKKRAGRRCSCWTVDSSADSLCNVCYGTGIVGGFDKYGTCLEIVDVTHPNIRAINVIPDYSKKTKPIMFTLVPGAKYGRIEVRVELKQNVGKLDVVKASKDTEDGGELDAYIRSPTETEYVAFTRDALEQRLQNPWVDVRVDFTRNSIKAVSPKFNHFYIRYKRKENLTVLANIPRASKSNLLAEMGVSDDWEFQQFFMDSTLRTITTEDFIISSKNMVRWKINSVKESSPGDYLLSWDLTARLVQQYEPMNFVYF